MSPCSRGQPDGVEMNKSIAVSFTVPVISSYIYIMLCTSRVYGGRHILSIRDYSGYRFQTHWLNEEGDSRMNDGLIPPSRVVPLAGTEMASERAAVDTNGDSLR